MKVLLLGANSQLGWELQRTCPEKIQLISCDYPKVDFCSKTSIKQCLETSKPDCIINAAAYTAVDLAEKEIQTAFKVNHEAVADIAQYAGQNDIRLVHISTDYVFNGKNYRPWTIEDSPCPESVYGKSKLEGEIAVRDILKNKALIIRTAWLYSSHGENFVKTMLKLITKKNSLNVVDDQVGTPTWAYGLAKGVWEFIEKSLSGIFHWTDAGIASWYDFAIAIQEEAMGLGLITKTIPILPISSKEFPTPAQRPFYGILDKNMTWKTTAGLNPVHWRVQLRAMLKELN
ncbi:MAG: dTDP-4-dehydrorhamnose reductase [Deltaproteobacteria bacterium]|uniref:dTDP-4-dehydrorhamnose reductase n=1 Tax=Desulfobacula sp. TaxID=2593537 RepID=UPI0019C56D14|nr:dTDP-4-dehydrorhamnose reductase [Candidatus Desulfobacula maris]MBL6995848.1 dTDP-4-dehydrorhamnose reductase [Desulfobacula sp.]